MRVKRRRFEVALRASRRCERVTRSRVLNWAPVGHVTLLGCRCDDSPFRSRKAARQYSFTTCRRTTHICSVVDPFVMSPLDFTLALLLVTHNLSLVQQVPSFCSRLFLALLSFDRGLNHKWVTVVDDNASWLRSTAFLSVLSLRGALWVKNIREALRKTAIYVSFRVSLCHRVVTTTRTPQSFHGQVLLRSACWS